MGSRNYFSQWTIARAEHLRIIMQTDPQTKCMSKRKDMTQISRNAMSNEQDDRQLLRWFGLLVAIGPIHMAEQMMFGLDTLNELKD